jgi:hypothetical protein
MIGPVGDSGYRAPLPGADCSPFIWREDRFNDPPLLSYWVWQPGAGGTYSVGDSLSARLFFDSSALIMTAPAHVDLFPGNTNAPFLFHQQGTHNDGVGLAVRTGFVGVRGPYEGSGLVMWLDVNNYARLEFAQASGVAAAGIEFDVMDNGRLTRVAPLASTPFGKASEPSSDGRSTGTPPIYLELVTFRGTTTAAWSADGVTWKSASYPRSFVGAKTGLDTINTGSTGGYWGAFDDFLNFVCNQRID